MFFACGLHKWCLCWHFGIKDLGGFFARPQTHPVGDTTFGQLPRLTTQLVSSCKVVSGDLQAASFASFFFCVCPFSVCSWLNESSQSQVGRSLVSLSREHVFATGGGMFGFRLGCLALYLVRMKGCEPSSVLLSKSSHNVQHHTNA